MVNGVVHRIDAAMARERKIDGKFTVVAFLREVSWPIGKCSVGVHCVCDDDAIAASAWSLRVCMTLSGSKGRARFYLGARVPPGAIFPPTHRWYSQLSVMRRKKMPAIATTCTTTGLPTLRPYPSDADGSCTTDAVLPGPGAQRDEARVRCGWVWGVHRDAHPARLHWASADSGTDGDCYGPAP